MKIDSIVELSDGSILQTYGRIKLAFEEGNGAVLYDVDGDEYLDFTSGLGVNALGYGHPVVAEAVRKQASKVFHTSNLYYIPSQAVLAEKICGSCFGERIFFCNSGAEAIEGAIKFARKWGKQFESPKYGIVVFANSFHGRTYGALSATMQEKYRKGFEPLVPGFVAAEFNNIDSVKQAVSKSTAAVLVEPLQGEGGVNFAAEGFLRQVEDLCRERDILLIVDEVQCGLGRTGELYAHEHFGIAPDIMALAKPLAGGLPVGAVVVGSKVWPHIQPGDHASTFGGNHLVTGVACAVFDLLSDPGFLEDVAEKGDHLRKKLDEIAAKYPAVKEVRGKGLLMGLLVDFPAKEAVEYFLQEKMLICAAGPDVIRFIPPLIVTRDDIGRVIDTLDRFLAGRT